MFPELNQSKILIHVTFHYSQERIKYLEEILRHIGDYQFRTIDVVIDTNDEQLSKTTFAAFNHKALRIRVDIHNDLDHPFLLTWQHRKNMENVMGDYDYFMYLEDDIGISYESLLRWRDDSITLSQTGFTRGFLRTEIDTHNRLVSTDQVKKHTLRNIVIINGKLYLRPENPYQAFWIYDKQQMQRFIKTTAWQNGDFPKWDIRERAAAGMLWHGVRRHKSLIPLRDDLTIPIDVTIRHIPNNYALDSQSKFGAIPIDEILDLSTFSQKILDIRCWFQRFLK